MNKFTVIKVKGFITEHLPLMHHICLFMNLHNYFLLNIDILFKSSKIFIMK